MAQVRTHLVKKADSSKEILRFASKLEDSLRSNPRPPPSLATDLYKQIDELTEQRAVISHEFRELDEQVRVFACLLLDCGYQYISASAQNTIRILKLTLKTVKLCLDQKQLALGERIAEKAASYEESLKQCQIVARQELGDTRDDLTNRYLMMRVSLAWQQNRLDLAENWLVKLESRPLPLGPVLTEDLSDLLYEIGKERHGQAAHGMAVSWLERAHNTLRSVGLQELSSDAGDLETAILHTLVRCLMMLPGNEAHKKAWNVANNLNTRSEDSMIVLTLKLDLFDKDLEYDPQDYCDVLIRIVRSIRITDSSLSTILHYFHKLRGRSPMLAHTVLEDLLLKRLAASDNQDWIDKTLVTLTWNLTASIGVIDDVQLLSQVLDTLPNQLLKGVRASATHAIQILLWKRIEVSYNREEFATAIRLCQLALHNIFDKTGELNNGKIQRKLLLCALATANYSEARNTYACMSPLCQSAQETQFLMYKVGLRSNDSDLAAECLEAIYQKCVDDAALLYACVLEAQQTGQRKQAISAMQRVLDKCNYGSPPGVNLPALLRSIARLLIQELESATEQSDSTVDAICKVFEGAASQARIQRRDPSNQNFTVLELDWFSRNTYNLSLKYCTEWNHSKTLCLLNACLKFIDLYPSDMEENVLSDLSLRHMFCDFLGASLLTVMAREEDVIESQLQYYLDVRKHAGSFQNHFLAQISSFEGGAKEDLRCKASALVSFDFEAAVQLKAWEDASQIVKDSQDREDPKLYGILADILLSSEAPTETIISILQQIVNISWRLNGIDETKLSRWIRCLFQLALTSNTEIAEFLLGQVLTLANDETMEYPPEELEWLATTTFNRAVDFYCASHDESCKRWAEMALAVAETAKDGGQLHELLQEKYLGLKWKD